jgi:hypothetical protein
MILDLSDEQAALLEEELTAIIEGDLVCRRRSGSGGCPGAVHRVVQGVQPSVEPDPAEGARRYDTETTVPDWVSGSSVPAAGATVQTWS